LLQYRRSGVHGDQPDRRQAAAVLPEWAGTRVNDRDSNWGGIVAGPARNDDAAPLPPRISPPNPTCTGPQCNALMDVSVEFLQHR